MQGEWVKRCDTRLKGRPTCVPAGLFCGDWPSPYCHVRHAHRTLLPALSTRYLARRLGVSTGLAAQAASKQQVWGASGPLSSGLPAPVATALQPGDALQVRPARLDTCFFIQSARLCARNALERCLHACFVPRKWRAPRQCPLRSTARRAHRPPALTHARTGRRRLHDGRLHAARAWRCVSRPLCFPECCPAPGRVHSLRLVPVPTRCCLSRQRAR